MYIEEVFIWSVYYHGHLFDVIFMFYSICYIVALNSSRYSQCILFLPTVVLAIAICHHRFLEFSLLKLWVMTKSMKYFFYLASVWIVLFFDILLIIGVLLKKLCAVVRHQATPCKIVP